MNGVDGATAALWTLAAAVVTGLATLVPPIISALRMRIEKDRAETERQREQIEIERVRLRREAAFEGALTAELRGKNQPNLTGAEKMAQAVQLANDATPNSVTVTSADVEAALPRVRASLATPSEPAGPNVHVTLVSSEPPAPSATEDRATNPIPGQPRMPKEWRVETSQAAGLSPSKKEPR